MITEMTMERLLTLHYGEILTFYITKVKKRGCSDLLMFAKAYCNPSGGMIGYPTLTYKCPRERNNEF